MILVNKMFPFFPFDAHKLSVAFLIFILRIILMVVLSVVLVVKLSLAKKDFRVKNSNYKSKFI